MNPPKRNSAHSLVYSPHCSKCGKSIIVGTGPYPVSKVNEIMLKIGWELNPVVCRGCLEAEKKYEPVARTV
jgi:hypothetical protein